MGNVLISARNQGRSGCNCMIVGFTTT